VTRRSWVLIASAALALACGGGEHKVKPPKLRPGEIHVNVDTTGRIEVNEQEVSLDSLKALLAGQKGAGKSVFYTRQRPVGPPTPEQWIVFMAVSEAQLPIRFEGDTQPLKPTKL
jgi:hypothetical protein